MFNMCVIFKPFEASYVQKTNRYIVVFSTASEYSAQPYIIGVQMKQMTRHRV